MKKKRIFVVFLVVTLVLSLLSCQKSEVVTTSETTTHDAPEKTRYELLLETLPTADFEGREFRIATDSPAIVYPAGGASFVGKERHLAIRAVEEKYGIKIVLTDESGLPTLADRLRTEAMAGSSYCDLAVMQSSALQALYSDSLLYNVRTIPYLDLDCDCYLPDSLEEATFGDGTFAFSGDWILEPEKIYGVFFNKTLLSKTNLPDLYDLVRTNQWDFEFFLQYAEEVFSLGKVDGAKVYGFTSPQSSEDLVSALWASSGMKFLKNDYGTRPELAYDTEETTTFIRQARNILFRSGAYLNNPAAADSAFRTGTVLFCVAPLSKASEYTGVGLNWGLLPLPKMDINQQRFVSFQTADHAMAAILKGTPDPSFSGQVTKALFYAGKEQSQRLALTTFLNLYLNAPEDGEMMKLVMRDVYFDPVAFFNRVDESYPAATQTLLYRVISSEGDFPTLYAQYSKMFNRYVDQNYHAK